jgi:hypothetical protein
MAPLQPQPVQPQPMQPPQQAPQQVPQSYQRPTNPYATAPGANPFKNSGLARFLLTPGRNG